VQRLSEGTPAAPAADARRRGQEDAGKDAKKEGGKSNRAPRVGCSVCCGGYP